MILSKLQKCIVMRNNIQIWVDEEKAKNISNDLISGNMKGFFMVNGTILNTADVIGIFEPIDMENMQRQKNGQWQCKKNIWHNKNEKCSCFNAEKAEEEIRRMYPQY